MKLSSFCYKEKITPDFQTIILLETSKNLKNRFNLNVEINFLEEFILFIKLLEINKKCSCQY